MLRQFGGISGLYEREAHNHFRKSHYLVRKFGWWWLGLTDLVRGLDNSDWVIVCKSYSVA